MSKVEIFDKDYFENGVKTGKSNYSDYSWERLGSYFETTARHIVENFNPKTALDVGCAKGFLVKALAVQGVDAKGVDISEYALENSIVPDNTQFGKVQKLPFKDNSFDVVTAFDVMEYVPAKDITQSCKEIMRVSKKWVIIRVVTEKLPGDLDSSHETIKPKEYWEKQFPAVDNTPFVNSGVWWFNVPQFLVIAKKSE